MKMKVMLSFVIAAATLICATSTAYAAENSAENVVIAEHQQTESKPEFKFGKGLRKLSFNGEKKFSALPEGFEKYESGKFAAKGFGKFKNADGSLEIDKEAMQEKLASALAEGKITQEKYDAIISGEVKAFFTDKKMPAALPEGFEKPETGKLAAKGFGKFKNADGSLKIDKEAMKEKLAAALAEGKITQKKYDAIISGEEKPSFSGKKMPFFLKKNEVADTDSDSYRNPQI